MSKTKRVRRDAAMWRELFSRQGSCGLTVTEFCRREGINAGLFRRWRSARDRSGVDVAAPDSASGAKSMAPFIDLGALSSRASRFEVRLELGDGVVLNLVRGYRGRALRGPIRSLGQALLPAQVCQGFVRRGDQGRCARARPRLLPHSA